MAVVFINDIKNHKRIYGLPHRAMLSNTWRSYLNLLVVSSSYLD